MSLDNLPADVSRHRVLDTRETCDFVKISVPHWYRMHRSGETPTPVRLGARKLGWKIGDLIAWIDSRTQAAA